MADFDYKQLCAELLDDLELCDWPYKLKEAIRADIDRARAALAEPELADGKVAELVSWLIDEAMPEPADGEVAKLVSWLLDEAIQAADASQPTAARKLTWAARLISEHAELLQRQAPVPVPVSERLPGAEDCDAEGRCWLFRLGQDSVGDWLQRAPYPSADAYRFFCVTHWLPAHALPIPRHD